MMNSKEDLTSRCQREVDRLKSTDRYRDPRITEILPNGRCIVDGQTVLNFGGNDYLNLAHDAANTTIKRSLAGSTASPLVVGRSPSLAALEAELAAFEETDAAMVFPSGFAANLGVISGLTQATDAIFCDRDNHASIIDAARTSQARLFVYRREHLDKLEASIRRRRKDYSQILIVTDGVFSMDGRVANLPELCRIAEAYKATLIVDEAHGTGTLGRAGRGACEHHGVHHQVPIRIGTLSKAVGALGGFVCGPGSVIDWLRHSARTQFFSTALPPMICEAARSAIRKIPEATDQREKLAQLIQITVSTIKSLGLVPPERVVAPIVPILVGNDKKCQKASAGIFEKGCFVPAIRPPTVQDGTARLRLSLSTAHNTQDVKEAIRIVADTLQATTLP